MQVIHPDTLQIIVAEHEIVFELVQNNAAEHTIVFDLVQNNVAKHDIGAICKHFSVEMVQCLTK